MSYRIIITEHAEGDILRSAQWWAAKRSLDQATRWLDALDERCLSIAKEPERFALATEYRAFRYELREAHFGVGSRPTHRAVFTVAGEFVFILAVRHASQDSLRPGDLG